LSNLFGRYLVRAVPLTIGIVALAAWPAEKWLGDRVLWSLITGAVASAVVVSVTFAALAWSFEKPNRTFMTAYVAGFLGRMAALGGSILIFNMVDSLDVVSGAIAMLFVYLVLTALEIRQIHRFRSIF